MTTLMIKTHNTTGLKYFCKTTKTGKNFEGYNGSGKYWMRHIKKHGKNISTDVYGEFDETSLFERLFLEGEALLFSEMNNIVESKEWANLQPENGLDGNVKGNKHRKESIEKMKTNTRISRAQRQLLSSFQSELITCKYCGKSVNRFNHNRYHGNKCNLDKSFKIVNCLKCKRKIGINNIQAHTDKCFDNIVIKSLDTKKCKVCGKSISVYGIKIHEYTCKPKTEADLIKIKKRSCCLKCSLEVSNGNLSRHLIKCLS